VPYSEHSSFAELRAFVAWLRPVAITPSVNNDAGGAKAREMVALLTGPLGPMDRFVTGAAAGTPPV
jgi:DNA cross-link repair 1A protein